MSWTQKVHQFAKSWRGISIFYSMWVLVNFIFTLSEYQKTESVQKGEKELLGFTSCKAEQPLKGMELQEKD